MDILVKLPNYEDAAIDISKLRDYCLNPRHLRGQHKARVFASSLGLSSRDAGVLRDAIMDAIRVEDAVKTRTDQYGQRYVVDFEMRRMHGMQAKVRSAWIVRSGEDFPRLTSCYIL